jgi:hypothetical protein
MFARSRLAPALPASPEAVPAIDLELRYDGGEVRADLYIAVRGEDRAVRFLPRLEQAPIPFRVGMRLPADLPFSLRWPEDGRPAEWRSGRYEVCGALFESGSHPNVATYCYWSATTMLLVGPVPPERDPVSDGSAA